VPTYEYACDSCGKRYEKREGFDALARQKCQHCGKTANRVLHAPPIVFKGSGFYKTDSRGTSSATAGSSPSSGTSNGASEGASTDSTDTSTTEPAAAS
jgi:putative FmdB family regulatory protein